MTEKPEENSEPIDCEPTYPDGSAQNECWAETGYTVRKRPRADDEDLRVLRGD